jgi:hypothetical protein
MIYYLPLFLILSLSSITEVWGVNKKQRNWLLIFCTMFAIFFIGLRFYTGFDWNIYIDYFNKSITMGNTYGFENGYYFLNNLISLNIGYYYVLQGLASCFILISAMYFFKNNSKYPILIFSIFILLFFVALMSQIRQTIALGFIFISAKYIFERKFLPFLLLIFFACQFHISAIIALPLYFMNRNYGKATLLILIVVSQMSYLFPNIILSSLETVTPYLPSRLSDITQRYIILSSVFIQQAGMQTGIYYITNTLFAIFIIFIVNPKNNKECFFINTFAVATFIKGFSLGVGILERFMPYYLVFGIITYSLLISTEWKMPLLKQLAKPIIIACFLIVFLAIPFYNAIASTKISNITGRANKYQFVPYYNVLYHPEEASQRKDWNE